ncbi:hypothetical protein GBA52_003836 [Prunus armeniaca]|nr:hypothetical protein GBA52_003836 [Prunus armeniaca]
MASAATTPGTGHSPGSQYRLLLAYHAPRCYEAIDLVSPMLLAPANKKMTVVATNYFSKSIEGEALSSTKEADVERFILKNISYRFHCPQSLVTNNGS